MKKTEERKMLEQAFDNFDVSLLQKCLDLGYDMNAVDDYGDSFLSEAISCYGDEDWENTQIPVKQVISFLDFALKHGLDINHTYDDDGEIIGDAFDIIKYCYNDEIVEFLIQNGLNLNYMMKKDWSFYDEISVTVFLDERGSEAAKFVYYRERLITYYGAKPAYLLENNDSEEEKKLFDTVLSLDTEKISSLSKEDIIENELDSVLINRGQFYYPKEWYKNPLEYQKKLIAAFDVLVAKIGIENLSNDILFQCVYQQLPDLLEHLLEMGANPNVNAFNESYAWVKSSAMYELMKEGSYFSKDLFERFKTALLSHGAIVQNV